MNIFLRTRLGPSLLVLAFVVLVALIAVPWALAQATPALERVDIARGEARSATVVLDMEVGYLELHGWRDDRALVGVIDLGPGRTLARDVTTGDQLQVALRDGPRRALRIDGDPAWDLNLAADLPSEVVVRVGAGESMLDLRGTAVHRFDLEAGVGDHQVFLPDRDVDARLTTRVGELNVVVPRGAIVRLHVAPGLRELSLPEGFVAVPGGFVREGSGAVIDLTLAVGIGEVSVRTY